MGDGQRAALHVQHIARHDPARVLAEVEAKRRLVDQYEQLKASLDADHLGAEMRDIGRMEGMEDALRLLALPYADHPAYRQEWAP